MKRIISLLTLFALCFSLCGTTAFAAKDKTVKTGLKAEKISSFNVNSSDKLALANTRTPIIIAEDKDGNVRFLDAKGKNINDKSYDTGDMLDLLRWERSDAIMWDALGQADILMAGMAAGKENVFKRGLIGVDGTEYFPCEYDKIALYDGRCCVLLKLEEQDDKDLIKEIALFDIETKKPYPIEVPEELLGSDFFNFKCNLSDDGYLQLSGTYEWGDTCFYIFDPAGELVFSETDSSALDFYDSISGYWDYSGFFSVDEAFYNDKGELISATSLIITEVEGDWGMVEFYESGGYGLMDMEGNVLVEAEYDSIFYTGEYGYIEKDEKCALINSKGEILTELVYDRIETTANGVSMALKDGKVGLLNAEGKEITEFIFDEETMWWGVSQYGVSLVQKDGKLGIVDEKGKYLLEPEPDEEEVIFDHNAALINSRGDPDVFYMRSGAVVSAKYIIETDNYDLFEAYEDNKTILVDYGGNVLVKGGENSEYISAAGVDYVLGRVGKTVNVYQIKSK